MRLNPAGMIIGREKPAPVLFSPSQIPHSLSYQSTLLPVETWLFISCTKILLLLARDCSHHGAVCRSEIEIIKVAWFEMSKSCRYCYITLHNGSW